MNNPWENDDYLVEMFNSEYERDCKKNWWYGATTGIIIALVVAVAFDYFGFVPF